MSRSRGGGRGRDVRKLLDRIVAAGGEVQRCRKSTHYKVKLDGRMIGVVPATPSDHRSMLNTISQLRRGGLTL